MSEDASWEDLHPEFRAETLSCFDQDGIAKRIRAYSAIIEARRAEMECGPNQEPMAATEPDFLEYSEADRIIAHSLGVKLS